MLGPGYKDIKASTLILKHFSHCVIKRGLQQVISSLTRGGAKSKKVDLLRCFWKIDLEKIDFFDLYFCFLKAFFCFFGLKYTS